MLYRLSDNMIEGSVLYMIWRLSQRYLERFRRRHIARSASVSAIALAMFALVLILMPVSYKAGATTAHPHTVFQAMLDQALGESHSHADQPAAVDHSANSQPSLFLELSVPLSTYAAMASPGLAIELMVRSHQLTHNAGLVPATFDPDIPHLTSIQGSSEMGTALTMISAILAFLFFVLPIRCVWFSTQQLQGIYDAIIGPPPRFLAV